MPQPAGVGGRAFIATWRPVVRPWWHRARLLLGLLPALGLAACGSLPHDTDRRASIALAPHADSALLQTAKASTPAPGLTGVRLLPLGSFALDTRLQLVQRARHSLDVQYYVLDDDATGRLLQQQLAAAAARGVRVRLLVDDLYTGHTDSLLQSMAALNNVEVRLFNPFCCARQSGPIGRFAASLSDIYRLNHRMHNKLLIADGAMVVAGGRNIADGYFQRGVQHNFIDLDALVIGAVVPDLAAIFDRYWNSPVVRPIQGVSPSSDTVATLRQRFHSLTADARVSVPPELPEVDLLGYGSIAAELDAGRLGLVWGRAMAIADPPDKLDRDADKAWADSLAYQALMKIWTAEREVTITSPYLIPGALGNAAFESLRQRQVQVTVLTNSLAATDEPLVHTGYSRYRPQLVDAGVELYELSPTRSQRNKRLGNFGSSTGRLHAKTAVVDGDKTFIGSMNLDPRSRTQNTELGLFIESAQLAAEMQRVVKVSREQSAYRVQRSPTGGLQWRVVDGDVDEVLLEEPESSVWLKLHNLILGPLVPEQLL